MPPLTRLLAVIAAASASASFTATQTAMSLRGRACIHTNTPSEALVKLERQIQRAEALVSDRWSSTVAVTICHNAARFGLCWFFCFLKRFG